MGFTCAQCASQITNMAGSPKGLSCYNILNGNVGQTKFYLFASVSRTCSSHTILHEASLSQHCWRLSVHSRRLGTCNLSNGGAKLMNMLQ